MRPVTSSEVVLVAAATKTGSMNPTPPSVKTQHKQVEGPLRVFHSVGSAYHASHRVGLFGCAPNEAYFRATLLLYALQDGLHDVEKPLLHETEEELKHINFSC